MQRREFIGLIGGAAAWPLAVLAQQPKRIPVVGVLWHAGSQADEGVNWTLLQEGFRQVGLVPGKDIRVEERYPNEMPERFDSMAAELVSMNVDVLIANGLVASLAAKRATTTIPIVVSNGDPVGFGVVPSLSHPGGNITGASFFIVDLDTKRLQLFKEVFSKISRLALLGDPRAKFVMDKDMQNYTTAGRAVGVEIELFEVRDKSELETAFAKIRQSGCEGVIIGSNSIFTSSLRGDIAQQAVASRLPTVAWTSELAEAGCLMSYSALWSQIYGAMAVCVKRILAGEKAGDIPVQLPTKFEFIINQKTAKAIGLNLSEIVLSRADRIIE